MSIQIKRTDGVLTALDALVSGAIGNISSRMEARAPWRDGS